MFEIVHILTFLTHYNCSCLFVFLHALAGAGIDDVQNVYVPTTSALDVQSGIGNVTMAIANQDERIRSTQPENYIRRFRARVSRYISCPDPENAQDDSAKSPLDCIGAKLSTFSPARRLTDHIRIAKDERAFDIPLSTAGLFSKHN